MIFISPQRGILLLLSQTSILTIPPECHYINYVSIWLVERVLVLEDYHFIIFINTQQTLHQTCTPETQIERGAQYDFLLSSSFFKDTLEIHSFVRALQTEHFLQ